jgi:hypothetical protein
VFRLCTRPTLSLPPSLPLSLSQLVPSETLRDLSVADMHTALCGVASISVADWRKHTDVSPLLPQNLVRDFWSIVGEMDQAWRGKLLFFAVSATSPPPGGFQNLRPNRFKLTAEQGMPPGALPVAHSCFSTLVLPLDCTGYEDLRFRVLTAVRECDTFGLL